MSTEELVQKFAEANLGFTAEVAKQALENNKGEEFLVSIKEQLVRDAPQSTPNIIGVQLTSDICEYYDLPAPHGHGEDFYTSEQLAQKFADAGLPMYSSSADGSIKAGKTEQFMEGIIAMYVSHPRVSYDFIGDVLTVLTYNYIKQNGYEAETDPKAN